MIQINDTVRIGQVNYADKNHRFGMKRFHSSLHHNQTLTIQYIKYCGAIMTVLSNGKVVRTNLSILALLH